MGQTTIPDIITKVKNLRTERHNFTKNNQGLIGYGFRRRMNYFSSRIRKYEKLLHEKGIHVPY